MAPWRALALLLLLPLLLPCARGDLAPSPAEGSDFDSANVNSDSDDEPEAPLPSPPSPLLPDSSPPPSSPQASEDEATTVQKVRWCTTSLGELSFCKDVLPVLTVEGKQEWSCVTRNSPFACMDAIGQGEAELISLEAGLAYHAFANRSMKAIMMEMIGRDPEYDAVAVVKKTICEGRPGLTFTDLQEMRSCHGSYWSAAGWDIPLEALISSGAIDPKEANETPGINFDITLFSNFFGGSCAPGDRDSRRLCSACLVQETEGPCDFSDPYAGSAGAFRCLVEDAGEVAFTRTPIVSRFSAGGLLEQSWSTLPSTEFMYICPGGGCAQATDNPSYYNCSLGKVATNMVMTRNAISERDRQSIVTRLQEAASIAKWTYSLFVGTNAHSYLLSSSAVGLFPVDRLTREVLGHAGVIAERVHILNEHTTTLPNEDSSSGMMRFTWSWTPLLLSILALLGTLLL